MLTEYQEWSERAAFVIFNNISLSSDDNQAKMYQINLQDFVRWFLYARDVGVLFFLFFWKERAGIALNEINFMFLPV